MLASIPKSNIDSVHDKSTTLLMNYIELRPSLRAIPGGIGALAVVLVLAFLAVRASAMFGPPSWRPLMALMCLAMISVPWVLLGSAGRRQIGLQRPRHAGYLLIAVICGAAASALCFVLGYWLFGTSIDNWYVTVARSSYAVKPTTGFSLLMLHLMFTLPAMLFSPFGEELFFRGFLQQVLERRFSVRTSTHIEAGLFASAHLIHHGLLLTAAGWTLLPLSGALWMTLIFALGWMFAWLRRSSDSIFPAIVAHSAFNGMMNVFIFAYLWPL